MTKNKEEKIQSVNFDDGLVDKIPDFRESYKENYFDTTSRKLDIDLKKNKKNFGIITNFGLIFGIVLSWATVAWAVCTLNSVIKHYKDTVELYNISNESLILWMHGLSVCSLMAVIITLCLTLTRIFANKKPKIKPKTAITAFLEALSKVKKENN